MTKLKRKSMLTEVEKINKTDAFLNMYKDDKRMDFTFISNLKKDFEEYTVKELREIFSCKYKKGKFKIDTVSKFKFQEFEEGFYHHRYLKGSSFMFIKSNAQGIKALVKFCID